MGKRIVYCGDCGKSLREEDFTRGRASHQGNRPLCAACLPAGAPAPAPAPAAAAGSQSRSQLPAVRPPFRAAEGASPATWILLTGGCAAGVVALFLLLNTGTTTPSAPAVAAVHRPPDGGATAPEAPALPPPPPAPRPVVREEPGPASAETRVDPLRRLEAFLSDIRRIRDSDPEFARAAEVLSMLDAALEIAGTQRPEVARLRDEYRHARDARTRPPPPPNSPPVVAIDSPLPGTIVAPGSAISVTVSANDPDGRVAKVELLSGTSVIGTLAAPPYGFSASFPQAGTVDLTARATDDLGSTSTTKSVRLIVASGGTVLQFQDGVHPSPQYRGTADATIAEAATSRNYGASDTIKIDGMVNKDRKDDESGLLRWDLRTIPPGSLVESASLTVWVTNRAGGPYHVYAVRRLWEEREVSWTQPWELPGGRGAADRSATPVASLKAPAEGYFNLSLEGTALALVQSWVDGPGDNHGILLDNTDNGDGLGLSSREASIPERRPRLTIVVLPPAGKVVFSENFKSGPGRFTGGQVVTVDGARALAIPPKGITVKGAFSTTLRPTTTIRLRVKVPAEVEEVGFVTWSNRQQANAWYWIRGLRKGEWNDVAVRPALARGGWKMDGPPLGHEPFDNFTITFERVPQETRVLVREIEVRE